MMACIKNKYVFISISREDPFQRRILHQSKNIYLLQIDFSILIFVFHHKSVVLDIHGSKSRKKTMKIKYRGNNPRK